MLIKKNLKNAQYLVQSASNQNMHYWIDNL